MLDDFYDFYGDHNIRFKLILVDTIIIVSTNIYIVKIRYMFVSDIIIVL